MSELIRAIRGMNDVLPDETYGWQALEAIFRDCLQSYNYQEIRFPMVESTQLFKRSIGEVTDIVEKEMYTFTDLNGDSLTLRPEGTAGCVRAMLEHGLLHRQQNKVWYSGPMFRHEKPQQGRYRQFYQFGVEAFGVEGPYIEAELISICQQLWKKLQLDAHLELEINSLGTYTERSLYRDKLVEYFNDHIDDLDEDSQRRLHRNPLRILDSKNPKLQEIIANAPKLLEHLGETSHQHFKALCRCLETLKIPYRINPFLVRGLDYYGHTVFEWVTQHLGSQSTVCAGGRYDGLVEQLGGKPEPAVGFALGMERLLLLIKKLNEPFFKEQKPTVYFIAVSEAAIEHALLFATELRSAISNLSIHVNTSGASFKSQFKKADKSGAEIALILGDSEIESGTIGVKPLRLTQEQITISQSEMVRVLKEHLF